MLYESMLLFGVLFIAGMLFSTIFQQRHALNLRHALGMWLFLVLAVYFLWFWCHGGQTLAMKTWRIRLVDETGGRVNLFRATTRYLLSWGWFLPGLVLAWALDAKGWMLVGIPTFNLLLWALSVFANPQRQFLHDIVAGTRLIDVSPQSAKVAPPAKV
ncbi:RDD family protein [Herbaspirillum sp. RTI4]|uniref:RDD family protein n=1 Tax=Herbaspirillum sp. RTI4 TaxID=3048640 RepID=UPI003A0FE131